LVSVFGNQGEGRHVFCFVAFQTERILGDQSIYEGFRKPRDEVSDVVRRLRFIL
jgi:hypothetical protein